jgi:hypothetical protein
VTEDEPVTWLYMRITEHQARALLAGQVDEELRAMARCMVDWQWDLARNVAKPVQQAPVRRARRA